MDKDEARDKLIELLDVVFDDWQNLALTGLEAMPISQDTLAGARHGAKKEIKRIKQEVARYLYVLHPGEAQATGSAEGE